jgi:hypothetical protein
MAIPATHSARDVAAAAATRDPQSTLALLRRFIDQISTLFHQEVKLAAAEIHHSISSLLLGASSIAAAGTVPIKVSHSEPNST